MCAIYRAPTFEARLRAFIYYTTGGDAGAPMAPSTYACLPVSWRVGDTCVVDDSREGVFNAH